MKRVKTGPHAKMFPRFWAAECVLVVVLLLTLVVFATTLQTVTEKL